MSTRSTNVLMMSICLATLFALSACKRSKQKLMPQRSAPASSAPAQKNTPASTAPDKEEPAAEPEDQPLPATINKKKMDENMAKTDGAVLEVMLAAANQVVGPVTPKEQKAGGKHKGTSDAVAIKAILSALGPKQTLKGKAKPCSPDYVFIFRDGEKDLGILSLCQDPDLTRMMIMDPIKKMQYSLTISDRDALTALLDKHLPHSKLKD